VEKAQNSSVYEDFLKVLPETECRWAVYDFEFSKEEGGKRNKIIFLNWYVGSTFLFFSEIKEPLARTNIRSMALS